MSANVSVPVSLQAHNLQLGYDRKTVIDDLSLSIPTGQITTILGPNGCGKSTLLRGLARLLRPMSGTVTLDGVPLNRINTRDIARHLAVLPQNPSAPGGLTVADLVSRGRYPRQRWYQQFSSTDQDYVHRSLEATNSVELADVPIEELSGGQRQRAWIAMTLAQDSDILLLDEPTTYLDLAHQVELLELIHHLNRDLGRTIVMVLHDISLAARFSDHIFALDHGQIVAEGTPHEVVTEQFMADVFGVAAHLIAEPVAGRPHVIPLAQITDTARENECHAAAVEQGV